MGAVAETALKLMRDGERDRDRILDALIGAGGKMSTLHLIEDLYGLAVVAIRESSPPAKEE